MRVHGVPIRDRGNERDEKRCREENKKQRELLPRNLQQKNRQSRSADSTIK